MKLKLVGHFFNSLAFLIRHPHVVVKSEYLEKLMKIKSILL